MNLSFEEFEYIRNNYNYDEKQDIVQQFFSLNYNNIKKINSLKRITVDFLKRHEDLDIKEISLVCDAFLMLHKTRDMDEVKKIIMPIWERISMYNQWYSNDIRMINTILFLFPIDTAIEFTKSVISRLNKYNDFRETEILKTSFTINLSLLLIKNGEYAKALNIIEESLQKYKRKMNYSILALHFSRTAICHFHLGYKDSYFFLDNANQLLLLYNDLEYWDRVFKEFKHYTSSES